MAKQIYDEKNASNSNQICIHVALSFGDKIFITIQFVLEVNICTQIASIP